MLLLDTNVVSELRKIKSGKADPIFSQWAIAQDTNQLYISVITILEIEMGVLQIERRDQQQGKMLRHWLEQQVMPAFDQRVLDIDTTVALRCAQLHIPDPRAERDALIAATALVHGMTIITRNIADFKEIGVQLINPWQPA